MISDIVDIIHGLSNLNWAVGAWVYAVIGCFIYICVCIVKLVYNLTEHLYDYYRFELERRKEKREQLILEIREQFVRVERIVKQNREEYRDGL